MAEVLTILEFASHKLSTFLAEEGRVLGGLRQEVQLIGDEFGHMKAFLKKVADSDQEDDPHLTEWIRQVREVTYDTEDVLDEFILLFASHRPQGFLRSILWTFKSVKNLPARQQLASNLQSVKARIKNISEARLRYESHYANILPRIPGRLAADNAWRHSKDDDALLAEEAQLVGIDKPKQFLISLLLNVDSQLKVIAVLGMGGLGKTTLVRKVHDDAAVESHFQIRAWVTVSQTCDFQYLLRGLIQQLQAQFNKPVLPLMDSMDTYQLKALLKDLLRRGRYAIVFDDVWDTEFWDAFKFVLPENSYGGNRVILTTRIGDVASASTIESRGYVYEMGCLNFQDSGTLFCRKIFKGMNCPAHLMNVAKSIVAKCGGLPLAILAIGGLLASKDWSRMNEWEVVQRRLGDEFEGTGKLDRVKQILSLSYNDLPPTLKACLLYTSIYPQGRKIPARHLISSLIAEGFVEQKEGQSAEEIAWDCLKELANRSLIQLNQVFYNGLYGFIHIHDLLREFIASKSREQNMVTIISTTTKQVRTGRPPGKVVRRLVFDHNLLEITSLESLHHINNLRSITNFGEKSSISKVALTKLLTGKLLTVLDLRGMHLEEIPKEIFKLFLLKYLGISGKKIETVPKSIKRLQNLECFVLEETNVKELPMEIQKLHKLRHLWFYERPADLLIAQLVHNGFKAPCGMGDLLELQTVCTIDAAEGDKTRIANEIGKLTKLRMLWIRNLRREDVRQLCSSLEKLTNLQDLLVASPVEKEEAITLDLNHPVSASSLQCLSLLQLFGRLEKMPPWIKYLQGLERINLSSSILTDDPLETLQHLPNLFEVFLFEAYQGESLCFEAGGFLKLKALFLKNMKGLRWVSVEKGAMPGISQLIMEELPLLEELPFGIEHLSQLQRLDLFAMSPQLINKLENAADSEEQNEDCKNISHVPQVTIGFLIDGRWKSHQLCPKKKAQVLPKKEAQPKSELERTLDAYLSVRIPRHPQVQHTLDAHVDGHRHGFGTLLFAFVFQAVCAVHVIVLAFKSFSFPPHSFILMLSLLFLVSLISLLHFHFRKHL